MPAAAALHLLLLLSFTFRPLFSTSTPQPRRILHQPLLPDDPAPPPAPSPPKYPFTTSAPDNSPFFQSYPSPPPPPAPASFASFPANISSITVPGPTKPNSSSPKLIIAAVAAVVAAITVVSLAVFLHLRHRTTSRRSSSFNKSKPPNSDTSSAVSFNQAPTSRHIPKLHRPSQSSSEFLYLGTLVNSHAPAAAVSGGGATRPNYSNAANSRKLDSPELRPLPPLNTRQQNSGNNAEVISSKDDESEEFYSPKGSINGRESSIGAGSASRGAFAAVVVENFNGSTSNSSSTYSSSLPGSGSPARSASFSLSPANNLSSINTMPKSPDLIEIQTIAPLPPQVASPPETRSSMLQVAASPSPPSSSSPDRQSRRSEEIPSKNSSVLDQSLESLAAMNSLVLHNTTANPAPPETRGLEIPACQSPSSLASSSPESSPRNSTVSDRSMESPVRTYIAVEIELHNDNDIPTSPELLEYATPLVLTSSPRNSNVSDQNLESPVRHNSHLQHTPPEIRGLEILESASPLPLSSLSPERCSTKSAESSPRNSNVSDQLAESPLRSNIPAYNNSDVIPPPPEMQGFVLPESAPAPLPNSDVWDWNVESPVRSCNLAQQNAAEIPIAPEIQPESTLPLSPILYSTERCLISSEESSPKNSNVPDHIESPVIIGSSEQHNGTAVPTTTENEALVSPEFGSPLAPGLYLSSEESSPSTSNISDQNVESPVGIISPAKHNPDEIPTSPEMEALVLPESTSPLACGASSPARYLSSEESSPRNSNVSDQNMEPPASPVLESPASNNYPRKNEDASPRISNASDQDAESPVMHDLVLSSPERMPMFSDQNAASPVPAPSPRDSPASNNYPRKNEDASPRISNASDQDAESPVMHDLVLSSPERMPMFSDQNAASPVPAPSPPDSPASNNYPRKNEDASPRISNASGQDTESPVMHDLVLSSPERMPMFSDQNAASPVRISSTEEHKLPSPSPSTPSSPERYRTESDESTSKTLNVFHDPNMESTSSNGSSLQPPAPPVSVNAPPPLSVPPPPPPPPPPPHPALSPRTPTPAEKNPLEPPALVNPLRPIGFESSALISPMQLPSQNDEDSLNPKPKLKPLHWDKVRASSDREMVWDQLKCSSFKLDEEMIETLFVVNTSNPNPNEATRWQVLPPPGLDSGDKVLDPKKSQNIAILLKALHVTVDEVCEGLLEGNAEILGTELLESLLKMAPSKEEERKLKAHDDDSSIKLGPAERFLKAVVDIPHAFKRVEALLYVSNFESEVEYLKKSFATLEAACEELRTSRMFLKLLEAVLKTGNRMNVGTNRGDAHAFKLDTLLKLVDVKGADGKTTLLHFVVQEIIRSEGARLSGEQHHVVEETNNDAKCRKLGLQVVSALSLELSSVKKAAVMDAEVLSTYVSKLSKGITNVNEILKLNEAAASMEESSKFAESMNSFMNNAEEEIFKIQAQERLALSLVKEITEYFHGNSAMEEPHPFRIFMVVRDFLTVLDRVCKEVGMINERTIVSSAHRFPVPVNPMLQQATGAFHRRQQTSSDDESLLPFNV